MMIIALVLLALGLLAIKVTHWALLYEQRKREEVK